MKRRTFLTAPLAASAISAMAVETVGPDQQKPLVVGNEKDRNGKSFNFLGARFDLKVSGKDCHGAMSIYETYRTEKKGPQLHSHNDLDEWFYVMEGEFKFQVGEEIFRLKGGDSILGPKGIPHAFVKVSDGPARLMVQHAPAGTMEEYFLEAVAMNSPTPEGRQALMRKHNMNPVGPPLTPD